MANCSDCKYWRGDSTTAIAACGNPASYNIRTYYNDTCPNHTPVSAQEAPRQAMVPNATIGLVNCCPNCWPRQTWIHVGIVGFSCGRCLHSWS
jgi:hypothetical protein